MAPARTRPPVTLGPPARRQHDAAEAGRSRRRWRATRVSSSGSSPSTSKRSPLPEVASTPNVLAHTSCCPPNAEAALQRQPDECPRNPFCRTPRHHELPGRPIAKVVPRSREHKPLESLSIVQSACARARAWPTRAHTALRPRRVFSSADAGRAVLLDRARARRDLDAPVPAEGAELGSRDIARGARRGRRAAGHERPA